MIPFGFDAMQPLYPLIVQQCMDDYGLEEGVAVEVGAGPGHLSVEFAKATSMELILVDIDGAALGKARERIEAAKADNIVSYLQADAEQLPLREESADFVISRGSIGFWKHPVSGLKECLRILKPGGTALVGVGAGRYLPPTLRRRIYSAMAADAKGKPDRPQRYTPEEYETFAQAAGLRNYRVISEGSDNTGTWLEFRKPGS